MKKILFTASLFLIFFISKAQKQTQDTIQYRKVEPELALLLNGQGTFIAPAIGYGWKRHSVYAGIVNVYRIASGGFATGYKFYPNFRHRRASLFLAYNAVFISMREYDSYYTVKPPYNQLNLSNTIGYGFDLRLLMEFYLTAEFGMGFRYGWRDKPNPKYKSELLRTEMIKVGIRKRFKK